MTRRNSILAALMVAIYTIATIGSSLSIVLCDHHHHHHHTAHDHHSSEECCCNGLSFEAECCNHHHPIMGENHTDYIASTQRFDSRSSESMTLMLMPALLPSPLCEVAAEIGDEHPSYHGDEHRPLVAAFISHSSLRAPPTLA